MAQRRPEHGLVPRDTLVPLTQETWARLRALYPDDHVQKIGIAMRLALDLDTCRAPMERRSVDPVRLDNAELARAKQRSLVRLVAPIDLLWDHREAP
jgi:hypothetical protein